MIVIILLLVVLPLTGTMLKQRNLVIKVKQKATANTLKEIIVHKKPQTKLKITEKFRTFCPKESEF
jgi:hypothetical protein